MSSQTPNLNLTLPVGTEKVSRQIINENMTKIDQYCGAINQSTYRKIPFTLALADWSQSGGQWVVNFDTIYVTDTSDDNVKFSDSIVSYEKAHIFWEKKSGGGGIKFTTATKPTGAITGVITAFDNDDGKVPTLLEDTVTPIANGGTGQSTLNGAKQALGITDLADHMANYLLNVTKNAGASGTTNANGNLVITGKTTSNCMIYHCQCPGYIVSVFTNAEGQYNLNFLNGDGTKAANVVISNAKYYYIDI